MQFIESSVIGVRAACIRLSAGRDALAVSTLGQRKIHADVSTDEFHVAWADVPWYQRVLLLFGAPVYGLWLYFTGTRQSIGRRMNTEEVESSRDFERSERTPELEAHMRVVSRMLTSKYGYRVVDSEWVTVFDYQE